VTEKTFNCMLVSMSYLYRCMKYSVINRWQSFRWSTRFPRSILVFLQSKLFFQVLLIYPCIPRICWRSHTPIARYPSWLFLTTCNRHLGTHKVLHPTLVSIQHELLVREDLFFLVVAYFSPVSLYLRFGAALSRHHFDMSFYSVESNGHRMF